MQQQTVHQQTITSQSDVIYDDLSKSVFNFKMLSPNINLYTQIYKQITPSAPTLIDISRQVYAELTMVEPNLYKIILPEYLDYYSTSLLWFRFISLKMKLSQSMTPEERDLLPILQQFSFSIPEPILLQLQVFGSIQTMIGEHLYPWFPKLPTSQIGDYGGFYGPVTTDNHNLYEELPCLGVLSEAIRRSISDAPPGPYASSLNTNELTMTENLLGYRPLGLRDNEAKKIAFNVGITDKSFPCNPPNTSVNMALIMSISSIIAVIAQTKTFKVFTVNFYNLNKSGSVIQTMMVYPIISLFNQQEKHGQLQVTSLTNETLSMFRAAIVFCPQLWKKASTITTAKSWSCATPVKDEWIENRNDRRNTLPLQYRQEIFKSIPQFSKPYRSEECEQRELKCEQEKKISRVSASYSSKGKK